MHELVPEWRVRSSATFECICYENEDDVKMPSTVHDAIKRAPASAENGRRGTVNSGGRELLGTHS